MILGEEDGGRQACELFHNWTFAFYGLFTGEDICKMAKPHWIQPDDEVIIL